MNNMEKIKFLVGNKEIKKILLSPYDKEVLDFLGDLANYELYSWKLTLESTRYRHLRLLAYISWRELHVKSVR